MRGWRRDLQRRPTVVPTRSPRWIGADAPDDPPAVVRFTAPGAGRLVLCSDGLWNTASNDEIARMVRSPSPHHEAHRRRPRVDRRRGAGGWPRQRHGRGRRPRSRCIRARGVLMTAFTVDVHHNQYLAPGATLVEGLVRVTSTTPHESAPAPDAVAILIVDTSGSMGHPPTKLSAAARATVAAVDCIRDGVRFAVVAGTQTRDAGVPIRRRARGGRRGDTCHAAAAAVRALRAEGGTAIGSWLRCTDSAARPRIRPRSTTRSSSPTAATSTRPPPTSPRHCAAARAASSATAEAQDWEVEELRTVSSALLGSVDILPDPSDTAAMTADFVAMMRSAMGKAVDDVARSGCGRRAGCRSHSCSRSILRSRTSPTGAPS